jgi:hypothetical protein
MTDTTRPDKSDVEQYSAQATELLEEFPSD